MSDEDEGSERTDEHPAVEAKEQFFVVTIRYDNAIEVVENVEAPDADTLYAQLVRQVTEDQLIQLDHHDETPFFFVAGPGTSVRVFPKALFDRYRREEQRQAQLAQLAQASAAGRGRPLVPR